MSSRAPCARGWRPSSPAIVPGRAGGSRVRLPDRAEQDERRREAPARSADAARRGSSTTRRGSKAADRGRPRAGAAPGRTTVVNSLMATVTARCSRFRRAAVARAAAARRKPSVHAAARRGAWSGSTIATAAGVLDDLEQRQGGPKRLFLDLCRALLDVLTFYGNTQSTLSSRAPGARRVAGHVRRVRRRAVDGRARVNASA